MLTIVFHSSYLLSHCLIFSGVSHLSASQTFSKIFDHLWRSPWCGWKDFCVSPSMSKNLFMIPRRKIGDSILSASIWTQWKQHLFVCHMTMQMLRYECTVQWISVLAVSILSILAHCNTKQMQTHTDRWSMHIMEIHTYQHTCKRLLLSSASSWMALMSPTAKPTWGQNIFN